MKRIGSICDGTTYRWQALLISVLLPASVCPAQVTYHVNGACGDNAWTGLSPTCAAPDGPKATIQAAIDAAADGDTVLVAPGTYVGDYLLTRVLTLQSTDGPEATTLTPGAWRPILICNVAMNERPTISGFRFADGGGWGYTPYGGAIWVESGSPVVTDCEFYGNRATVAGGAVYAPDGSFLTLLRCLFVGNITFNTSYFSNSGAVRADQLLVDACRFENNRAMSFAEGTWAGALSGAGVVTNSTFIGNAAGVGGAAALGPASSIVNCTIVSNEGPDGSIIFGFGDVSVFNSIVQGNAASFPINSYTGADVRYSNVQGGFPGEGNIDADPRFLVNPDPPPSLGGCFSCPIGVGDLRLRAGSPCIDAADNTALPPEITLDLAGEPRFMDVPCAPDTGVPGGMGGANVVDIGAYEASFPDSGGDCDGDGLSDCEEIAAGEPDCDFNYLPDACQTDPSFDCDGDGTIDECQIAADPSLDCNGNGRLDSCDIAEGASDDCDADGTPDECQPAPPFPTAGDHLFFSGGASKVLVPGLGTAMPSDEITIELWQFAIEARQQTTFSAAPENPSDRVLAHTPWEDGVVYWDFGSWETGRLAYVPPEPIIGSWQHFAFVASQSGNYMRIYRNGVLEAERTGFEGYDGSGTDFEIGNHGDPSWQLGFYGAIDEFRVWSVAQTGAQIQANMNRRVNPASPGLFAYYRLDEGAGTTTSDLAGSHDGQVWNAVWQHPPNCLPVIEPRRLRP